MFSKTLIWDYIYREMDYERGFIKLSALNKNNHTTRKIW